MRIDRQVATIEREAWDVRPPRQHSVGRRTALRLALAGALAVVWPVAAGAAESIDVFALRNYEVGAEFSLSNQHGGTTSLADLRGKVVVLMFGFTHCPDVCPTTLVDLRSALRGLDTGAEHVAVVFITVDPGRDTPERLGAYLAHFDPSFIGLTGSDEDIAAVAGSFSTEFLRHDPDGSGFYTVDHTSYVYLLDGSGATRYVLPHTSGPRLFREGMEKLLGAPG